MVAFPPRPTLDPVDESSPHAPWALAGEAVVGAVPRRGRAIGRLGSGLSPLPGPALVVAVRYDASPIGPFCELDVVEPARLGARPGWSVTVSIVNDGRARMGGRGNWGLPRELGSLVWTADAAVVSVTWAERGLRLTAHRRAGACPFLVPMRLLQRRSDGPVAVPLRLRALARRASVEVEVAEGEDSLAAIAGRHRGLVLSSERLRIHRARHPAGFLHTLRAPLRPPEPGVAGAGLASVGAAAAQLQWPPPGRMAQLVRAQPSHG